MRKLVIIRENELRKYLGKRVWVEREGLVRNWISAEGTPKEGELVGILSEDDMGFYVKMFRTYSDEIGAHTDEKTFLEEPYRLQDRDWIFFTKKKRPGSYLVRLP